MAFDVGNFNGEGSLTDKAIPPAIFRYKDVDDGIALIMGANFFLSQQSKLPVGTHINITSISGNYEAQVITSDQLSLDIGLFTGGIETITASGAMDLINAIKFMDTTGGAKAYTLPNGTDRQKITVTLVVDGGNAVLTPVTLNGFATLTFDNIGDSVDLEYQAVGGWTITRNSGAATA